MRNNNFQVVQGFSKLDKIEKIKWLMRTYLPNNCEEQSLVESFWHQNNEQQELLDGFSENTITNFPMPFGIAPNFMIDGEIHAIPMVIEESSVVAAASSAAKFWLSRGGFRTQIIGTKKVGQVHFEWPYDFRIIADQKESLESYLREGVTDLTQNMIHRGGGIEEFQWIDFGNELSNYVQLRVNFETCDSMGANFINSVLERFAQLLQDYFEKNYPKIDIIMSILSNHTPECVVKSTVSCPISELDFRDMTGEQFASKFYKAVRIAEIDPYRAATHNKGIYNGVDAVILATGNDFRAVEAAGHTYAAMNGQYKSLSHCALVDGQFSFTLQVPLAIGTVGGLTSIHPLAKYAMKVLGNPSAQKLMRIVSSVGLAQNFAAVKSLVTTGIQLGHMKMHLSNILQQLQANNDEKLQAEKHFETRPVSYTFVRDFLQELRSVGNFDI